MMNPKPCGACSALNQPCNVGCFWAQYIKVGEDEKFRILLRGNLDESNVKRLRKAIIKSRVVSRQSYVDKLFEKFREAAPEIEVEEAAPEIEGEEAAPETPLGDVGRSRFEWLNIGAQVLEFAELVPEESKKAILSLIERKGKEWVKMKISNAVKDLVQKADASACAAAAGDSAVDHRTLVVGNDDVVIVKTYWTQIYDIFEDFRKRVLKAVIEKTNVNPSEVGNIVVDVVSAPGSQIATKCRRAALWAGFPKTVPIKIVDRQCSSGLQAIADVAAAIKAGSCDIGIGVGLEFMTSSLLEGEGSVNSKVKILEQDQKCLLPTGITSEKFAPCFGVTRPEQDQVAFESHQRAAAATAFGKSKDEIIPVPTKIVDQKTSDKKPATISIDDGIQPVARFSDLAKLQPVFKDGSTTAGNSSQVSDGAGALLPMKRGTVVQKDSSKNKKGKGLSFLGPNAGSSDLTESQPVFKDWSTTAGNSSQMSAGAGAGAVLLMKRSIAEQKGLPILGVFKAFVAVPACEGVGLDAAILAAVKAACLELDDIDLFVINGAFASQFVDCSNKLKLDKEKVMNGGATGFGSVPMLLNEMKHRGKDCRLSMCLGFAMEAAALFEREDAVDDLCIPSSSKQ